MESSAQNKNHIVNNDDCLRRIVTHGTAIFYLIKESKKIEL